MLSKRPKACCFLVDNNNNNNEVLLQSSLVELLLQHIHVVLILFDIFDPFFETFGLWKSNVNTEYHTYPETRVCDHFPWPDGPI